MAKKIFLSPSSQIHNTYAAGNTNEAVQMGELGRLVEQNLKRCGFETKLMHTEATLQQRCAASNAWGADIHLAIHSNAFNGSVMGTRMMTGKNAESDKLSRCIGKYLFPLSPGQSDNYNNGMALYEMRAVKAIEAFHEVEFHDVAAGARWIIDNKPVIAEAITKGVCDYCGVQYVPESAPAPTPTPAPSSSETLYCVQIGAYKSKANAEKQAAKAKAAGFDAYIWQK